MRDECLAEGTPTEPRPSGIDGGGPPYEVKPPDRQERWVAHVGGDDRAVPAWLLTLATLAAFGLVWAGAAGWARLTRPTDSPLTGKAAIQAVVERIILVESNGDPNAKNKRSSATGTGQFLDGTWLEMIRAHRPDLVQGHSEKELLELRRRPELAREIATRLVEQNAAMLRRRGLPVTPGTLYLSYFAGPAGAVAILSVAENADAASLMAGADASGKTTRERLVSANPFLETFTVGDIKSWAERKMRGL
jgi:hypothetical protein